MREFISMLNATNSGLVPFKVPKRENLLLAFFYTRWSYLSMWLVNCKKSPFLSIYPWCPWFLPHTECAVNKKNWSLAKIKSLWWLLLSPYVCLQCLFWKKLKFWFFYECFKILRRIIFFSKHSVCLTLDTNGFLVQFSSHLPRWDRSV